MGPAEVASSNPTGTGLRRRRPATDQLPRNAQNREGDGELPRAVRRTRGAIVDATHSSTMATQALQRRVSSFVTHTTPKRPSSWYLFQVDEETLSAIILKLILRAFLASITRRSKPRQLVFQREILLGTQVGVEFDVEFR
jgi:hypothetical protein